MQILEMMGEMLRRAIKLRESGHLSEALSMLVLAQEKLFGRPAAAFASFDIAEQLRLLSIDETPENARTKCLAYASTLKEAGLIYQAHGKAMPAASAFQLALFVTLTVATDPRTPAKDLDPKIVQLLGLVEEDELYGPVAELLKKIRANGFELPV